MPSRRDRVVVAMASVLILAACAPSITTRLDGRFVVEAERSRGDFGGDSALVKEADAQITILLSHPVSFRFAAALVPRWQERLFSLSEGGIDTVAHRLATLRDHDPGLFAWAAPRLRHVVWDYSAVETAPVYTFDPDTQTLRMVLVSDSAGVVGFDGDMVAEAIARAAGVRYASTPPAALAVGDRDAYADWLIDFAWVTPPAPPVPRPYRDDGPRAPPRPDDEVIDAPRAHVLLQLLALADVVPSQAGSLGARLHTRIVRDAGYLGDVRYDEPSTVARLPASHDLVRADAAYGAWVTRNDGALSDADRVAVAKALARSSYREVPPRALAGLDIVAFTLHTLDRWVASGKPRRGNNADSASADLYYLVLGVCSSGQDYCDPGGWPAYKLAKTDERARARLFEAFLAKKDPLVTKTLMFDLLAMAGVETALAFWHATDTDEVMWKATSEALGARHTESPVLYDELARLWKSNPHRRGLYAYILYQYDTEGFRQNFVRVFSPLTQAEFAVLLDELPDPMREVPYLKWRLGKGWSRMDVIEPHLDAWLASPKYRSESTGGEVVWTMARDFCEEKSFGDVAKLRAWVARREAIHASEITSLQRASERLDACARASSAAGRAPPGGSRPKPSGPSLE